ncbi:MAG: helix-turn-helix domain-containing protein [Aerococcus sp.]|nr:helix-turn-helix domain-containing protein [Aerococcus sp.]
MEMSIGDYLKSVRTSKKWTQSQMGEALNVGQVTISQWERGKALPNDAVLDQVELLRLSLQDDPVMVFGECLKDIRLNRGWSRNVLSKKIGYSANTIYLWESGRKVPTPEVLRKYSQVVGVDERYLFNLCPCPWSAGKHGVFHTNCHHSCSISIEEDWEYCPYCGRRII